MSIDSNNKTLGLMSSYISYFLFCYSSNSFLLYFTDITLHNGLRLKKKKKKNLYLIIDSVHNLLFLWDSARMDSLREMRRCRRLMSTMPRKEWGNQRKRGCHLSQKQNFYFASVKH